MSDKEKKDELSRAFRPMVEGDLELVLQWRNNAYIRKYMYNQNKITIDEHKLWFQGRSKMDNQHLLIFELGGAPLGFVSFEIKAGGISDWGFYTSPSSPKGTGYKLGKTALNYAFGALGIHKINGEVLGFNKKSIDFHLRMGFKQEGVLREQYFDGELYHSVICFGLFKDELS